MKKDDDTVTALRALASLHHEDCPLGQMLHSAADALGGGQGPAQVATEAYRTGWEGIFGAKTKAGQA